MAEKEITDNSQKGAGDDLSKDTEKKEGEEDKSPVSTDTLTDEQWETAFKSPRFKELSQKAKEAEARLQEIENAKKSEAEKKLLEEKKYEELLKAKEDELMQLRTEREQSVKQQSIISVAVKLGARDPDAIAKLIDQTKVAVDKDGNVSGVEDAVKALLADKPYLASTQPASNIGSGANSEASDGNKKMWKKSELTNKMQDHKWYEENKEEIHAAIAEGRVDNSQ
jgi:hypothetical protein